LKVHETHQRVIWAVAGLWHEDDVAARSALERLSTLDIDGGG
jgi:hypothetical protein